MRASTVQVWPPSAAQITAVLPHCIVIRYRWERVNCNNHIHTDMQCVLCHMYSCTYCNTHAHISISGQDCHLRSEVSLTIPVSITCTHAALNSLTCTYMHNTIQYYMSLVYNSTHHQMYTTLTTSLLGSAPLSSNSCTVLWWPPLLVRWRAVCPRYRSEARRGGKECRSRWSPVH